MASGKVLIMILVQSEEKSRPQREVWKPETRMHLTQGNLIPFEDDEEFTSL